MVVRPQPVVRRARSTRRLTALLLLVVAAALVAACGDDDDDTTTSPASGSGSSAFPVTIEHAFGETVIPAEPTRVVTWGWASADAALAMGVVPVAIPFESYGADDEGVLPWIRERVEELGAEMPKVLPNTDEAPFEAIAEAKPDLILAPFSGITESEYETLSKIAPTVAYPGEAWATPWRDTIEIVGRALGRSDEATEVLKNIDEAIAAAAEAHPELEGKSVAMVWDAAGTFYVYKAADARVEFVQDLGMVTADSVTKLAEGADGSTFYFTLSYEHLADLESDILVSFADTKETSQQFLSSSHAQLMGQVQRGTVAEIIGPEFISSVSPPTALSLTWGLDEYVSILSAAAKKVDAAN